MPGRELSVSALVIGRGFCYYFIYVYYRKQKEAILAVQAVILSAELILILLVGYCAQKFKLVTENFGKYISAFVMIVKRKSANTYARGKWRISLNRI